MKTKTKIGIITAIIVLAIAAILASYVFVWGKGNLTIQTSATTQDLQSYYQPIVDIFENQKKIGTTSSPISLTVGRHVLTFGDIGSSYVTPSSVVADISLFHDFYTTINYQCTNCGLQVKSFLHDPLNETSIPANYVYIDNQKTGLSNGASSTSIYFDARTCTVTFPDVSGYVTPTPVTANLVPGTIQYVRSDYEKILTADEQATLQANQEAAQHKAWLDGLAERTSDLSRDNPNQYDVKFLQWTLDNRISIPVSYLSVNQQDATVRIAQYAGSLISDRENVIESINNKLIPFGYNLNKTSVTCYNDGGNEYIISVDLSIGLNREKDPQQTQETVYHFSNDTSIPNFCPTFIPVGISYDFGDSQGVYVKVGDLTQPMTSVYSGFRSFRNTPTGYQQGYWDAYSGISTKSLISYYTADELSKAIALVKGGIMGSTLVDFPDFCQSLLWKPYY